MRTESGVRARGDNPRSRGPAPDLLRADLRSTIETASAPGGSPTAFHRSLVGARPCRLVPLRGAGGIVHHPDRQAGGIGQALKLCLPQADAVAVGAAAVGGDRQCLCFRVALFAEVLPPRLDAGDRELRGFGRDPDRHPAFVVPHVVDPVGNRPAQLLVDEVMGVDEDRLARRGKLTPAVPVAADQLLLFAVDRDQRLPGSERLRGDLRDVLKLQIAIG